MNEASYISLLDMQRVMQRVLKRSGLPVWHTLGFNPHIYMTFACPLSLGQESQCECVDVKTEAENPDFAQWQTALASAVAVSGMELLRFLEMQWSKRQSAVQANVEALALVAVAGKMAMSRFPATQK